MLNIRQMDEKIFEGDNFNYDYLRIVSSQMPSFSNSAIFTKFCYL